MRLVSKLIVALTAGNLCLLAVEAYVAVDRDVGLIKEDMRREMISLGHVARTLIARTAGDRGEVEIRRLIEEVNRGDPEVQVGWVRLDSTAALAGRVLGDRELATLRGGSPVSITATSPTGGADVLHTVVPVGVRNGGLAAIDIAESLEPVIANTRSIIRARSMLLVGLLLVQGLTVYMIGMVIIGRPFRRIMDKIRRIGDGELAEPLVLDRNDELDQVAAALNSMCEHLLEARERLQEETERRIEAVDSLRHADRLRTVGLLASGVAHELGTPLNVVAMRAAMIAENPSSGPAAVEGAGAIRIQCDRMAGIIRQVLAFAHRPHSAMQPVDLCEAAQASVGFVASTVERSRKTIRLRDDASPLMVMADRVQIEQVLTNLLLNALQASGQRARIEVGFTREVRHPPDLGPGSERPVACVYVDDNGTGIPGEHLPHIFEPYYTTKDVDEGTGLGLAIAYTIVHEHGGWIDVQSDVGVGSRFSVYLPAESPSESDARPAPQPVGSTWSRWG